jgi:hypothetical protein
MKEFPNLIAHLGPIAERYLTLLRVHPTNRYKYSKRTDIDFPVIEIDRHGPKCKAGESWLYFAVPTTALIPLLTPNDRLYVGAQTQDRMFRGDGLRGNNYHHAEMRAGNGSDNPAAYLASGQEIAIYRVQSQQITAMVSEMSELEVLRELAKQPTTPKKHLGWWFEQYVLFSEPKLWRWNTASADKSIVKLLAS